MTATEERAAHIAGLRQLADALEAHPEIPLPRTGASGGPPVKLHFLGGPDPRGALAAAARLIPCTWRKEFSEADPDGRWPAYLDLRGQLGGLHLELTAKRDDVCTRVVKGTEEREVEEIVTPAVKRRVTRPVEVVEWTCAPVLADPATERARGAA